MNAIEKKRMADLESALAIQGTSGNWDFDPYMHGMYNGMALAVGILKGETAKYKEPPAKWLSDGEKCDTFVTKIRTLFWPYISVDASTHFKV